MNRSIANKRIPNYSKVPKGAIIDWGHPILHECRALIPFNEGAGAPRIYAPSHYGFSGNAKTSRVCALDDGSYYSWGRRGYQTQGDLNNLDFVLSTRLQFISRFTMLTIAFPTVSTPAWGGFLGGFVQYSYSGSADIELRYNWQDATYGWDSNICAPLNKEAFLLLSVNPAQGLLFCNGKHNVNISAHASFNNASGTTFRIGTDRSIATRSVTADYRLVMIWERDLSLAEILSLYQDPFQFIVNRNRILPCATSAAEPGSIDVEVNATIVSGSLSAGTATLSIQKNSNITATRCDASLLVGTATVSTVQDVNISATLISSKLSAGAVTIDNVKSCDIETSLISAWLTVGTVTVTVEAAADIEVSATLASASLIAGTATTSNVKNCNISATLISATLSVGTATVSAEGAGEVNVSATLISQTITMTSPTISAVKSSDVSANRISQYLKVQDPIISTEKFVTISVDTADMTLTVFDVTVTVVTPSTTGINDILLKESRINKYLNKSSAINKSLLLESEI